MSFSSLEFYLLAAACVAGYYILPPKARRFWLLFISFIYYAAAGPVFFVFLLFAAFTTWAGALRASDGKKIAVAIPLLLDFGVLAALKYSNFAISIINRLPHAELPYLKLLLPLGISFYTFQSAGYLLDVYWKRCEAEKSFLKYLLFVSFYPQIMQGPIGRYGTLAPQLQTAHAYDPENIRRGIVRISWGLFKKMIVADNAALYVNQIFDNYVTLRGYGIQGVLMYSIQLYADFSGGIDIAIGIAQMLGIRLDANFRQPYFAETLTDFWHRWHITLGTWMKDYLFYPISLSDWMSRMRKSTRKRFGRDLGSAICIGVANIIVFLAVGVWHGPSWHFIVYGLYNGILIAIGGLFTKQFRKMKTALHLTDHTPWFRVFRIARTFLIVNLSWYLDRSGSLGQAARMLMDSFSTKIFSLTIISPEDPHFAMQHFVPIAAGCAVIFIVSVLREKKKDVEGTIARLPWPVLVLIITGILILSALYGNRGSGGFIYANF